MSGGCQEVRPLLGGYVLGALEPDETAMVRAHLEVCRACAAEYDELAGLPELLDLGSRVQHRAEPVPPGLEERLLDAVARDRTGGRRRPRRPRLRIAVPVAAALVAAVVAFAVVSGGGDEGGPPAPSKPRYDLALQGARAAPQAWAGATLESVPGGTKVHLWVRDLPPDPEAVYEVHCDGRGWSASAGTFRVDGQGRAYAALTTAARVGEYERIRVTRQGRESDGIRTAAVLEGDLGG
jgi:hypothetical protein